MRWRLAALWASQSARAAADACLRLFVVLLAAAGAPAQRESAWHLVMALFMLPCVLLAPLNGALGNSLPKRRVLVAAAAYCLLVALLLGASGRGSAAALTMVALVALGSAVYVPTRFALLPAAALDCALPLVRVVAWIEAGVLLAMAAGMIAAGVLAEAAGPFGLPAALPLIWGLGLLSLLAALPAEFPADVRRPEPPVQALRGFFRDAARIAADRAALGALLGLAALRGIAAVAVGALIAAVLARAGRDSGDAYRVLLSVALLSMAGAGLGSVLSGLLRDRRRSLRLVPMGATALALALAWVAMAPAVPLPLCVAIGAMGGLVNVPMIVAYQSAVPADARGNGMAILNTAGYLSITALSLTMAGLSATRVLGARGQLGAVAALAWLAALAAWWLLRARTHSSR